MVQQLFLSQHAFELSQLVLYTQTGKLTDLQLEALLTPVVDFCPLFSGTTVVPVGFALPDFELTCGFLAVGSFHAAVLATSGTTFLDFVSEVCLVAGFLVLEFSGAAGCGKVTEFVAGFEDLVARVEGGGGFVDLCAMMPKLGDACGKSPSKLL